MQCERHWIFHGTQNSSINHSVLWVLYNEKNIMVNAIVIRPDLS